MTRRIHLYLLSIAAILSIFTFRADAQSVLTRHVRTAIQTGEAKYFGRLPANETMQLDLVLPLRNQPALDAFVKAVYDPSSPSYRHFLTPVEFTQRFGPSQADYDAVVAYAKANGLTVVGGSRDGMDVQVKGPVSAVEGALHLTMRTYQHPTENRIFYGPDSEPTTDLPFALWHVSGLDNYSIPHPMLEKRSDYAKAHGIEAKDVVSHATTGSGPSASFLGSDMRAAYYGGTALTGAGQNLGLFEYEGTDLADLTTYFKNVGQTNNVPVTLLSTDGTSTACTDNSAGGDCDDTEQTLDMTQALGMAPGMAGLTMWIGTGGLSGQSLDDPGILNGMATASPLNAQLSCSWAWKPADNTTDDPYFEEFSAQGQTFFAASGDDGNWAHATYVWPADDVNIVSVGGTDLDTSGAAGPWASETGWVDGGGGISPNKFTIPSWQVAAAAGCAKCSQTYRNGPDVSANANFTFYVCADQTKCTENTYGGTSFATPMWAGYLALANEQYLSNGATKTLGFINPALYTIGGGSSYDTDFHDCLTGGNTAYGCAVGYDLSTGWGSPNGSALINALTSVGPNFSLSASPNAVAIAKGGASGTSTITITPVHGFSGNVTLAASGLPKDVTASFTPNPATSSSVLTLTASSAAKVGKVTVTVTGTSGSLSATTTLTLTVDASGNFTLAASPKTLKVAQGSSGTSTITIKPTAGFDQEVTLSASGLPSGVTASFNTNPATSTSTLTLKVSGSAAAGKSTITITGKYGSLSHTTTVKLTVTS